ncbi:LppP/LprE family lipoprotein [Corynebacterium guangdongense]|uniref:LppP/LprE lipoprotein n=1 Tax=Corynebacterium guangdongense TaxID=1783348 RepID=A0ABU1ZZG1_9CORY|nr:LppP/LprE family lipoprotein [Corynebacterium guangdongense]MDR7330319.1 hypothetical protein [Corynebacterium guangdongense]WJZ18877.1 hypothetical protein CGUA_11705 [Corynebacterium guangdongense]
MRSALVSVALASAALTAACGSGGPPAPPGEMDAAVVTTTTVAQPPQPQQPRPGCASKGVGDSDFAPILDRGAVQLGELGAHNWEVTPREDSYFHFQLKEDGYDACRTLSYVVLEGSNGDAAGGNGIGASLAQAVVFFHHGDMITVPAPFEMRTVEEVGRTGDSSVRVLYGHAGGASAQGVTERYRMNFFWEDGLGLSGSGELPEGVDGHARLYLG